jgi:hypothetical protein
MTNNEAHICTYPTNLPTLNPKCSLSMDLLNKLSILLFGWKGP